MIIKIIAVSAVSLLLSLPSSGSAQERNPQALKALELLKQKIGNHFRVEWSEDGNRIKTIEMAEWNEKQIKKAPSLSLPQEVAGTPEEIATAFLQNNSELFQVPKDLADLYVKEVQDQSDGSYFVDIRQTFNGVPVFGGEIAIVVNLNDSRYTLKGIEFIRNDYVPNIDISTTALISKQEAIAIAKKDALQNPIIHRDKSGQSFRVIEFNKDNTAVISKEKNFKFGILITEQDEPVLVYKFFLSSVQYVIDANTGTIIGVGDMAMYASGTGDVFWPNPVNNLQKAAE